MKKSPIPNFPDVFFEVPEKAHFQYLTTLYGLEPYGVGTGACESLKSYIFRLADAHRVSSKTLLKEGIFNLLITQSNFWKSDRASQLKAVSCYLTPGKITEGLITVLNKATGVDGLASCTMLPMRNLLGTRNMFSSKERHCPLCLDEYKITGRLYGHLSWEIACVTA